MKKLIIMSDIHYDLNQLTPTELDILGETLTSVGTTHVHFAGDIANDAYQGTVPFIQYFNKNFPFSVTFNLGNHDMSLLSEEEIENFNNPDFLNFETRTLSNDLKLFAFNGWYDYTFAKTNHPEKIRTFKNSFWFDRKIHRVGTDPEITERVLTRLKIALEELKDEKLVIATHFVPRQEFIHYSNAYKNRWNTLNAFMGSKYFGECFAAYPNIQQVVFGHTHYRFDDLKIGATTYSAKPFGYVREWQLTDSFAKKYQLDCPSDPTNIPHRYREIKKHPDFPSYRRKHLASEFRKAMTIIEY
ncbi:MAG: metallophosphoesterase [Lactobacillales bacterium]|jgi:putative phosphoesterase|nr:metallophosphoesterase [Lactobacillales bacterium]